LVDLPKTLSEVLDLLTEEFFTLVYATTKGDLLTLVKVLCVAFTPSF